MSGPNPSIRRSSSCEHAFSTPRFVSAYLRNWVSFEGIFRVGERIEVEDDVRGRVGVVGGFEETQAMDAISQNLARAMATLKA